MYLHSLEIYERLAKANPAQFEPDLARTCMNLGIFYQAIQKMGEAEKMYLRSLEIYERFSKSNPAQFEPYLAMTVMNLGVFYIVVQKMGDAEKMYPGSAPVPGAADAAYGEKAIKCVLPEARALAGAGVVPPPVKLG